MSSKIAALTHPVENYVTLLQENLHLPIEDDIDGSIFIEGYMPDWGDSFLPPYGTLLSNASSICYFHYFYKDSALRTQYFDTIRAMGLREMWVMEELVLDYCNEDDMTIEDFLTSVNQRLQLSPYEFSEYSFETYDNGYGRKFPTDFGSLYHENFEDLFNKVSQIETAFNVQVIGLKEYPQNCIRVLKDNHLAFLDLSNNKIVDVRSV